MLGMRGDFEGVADWLAMLRLWSGRFLKSTWLSRQKHSELVANLLAPSRHVVIALSCPRQVFQPEKVRSLPQTCPKRVR